MLTGKGIEDIQGAIKGISTGVPLARNATRNQPYSLPYRYHILTERQE